MIKFTSDSSNIVLTVPQATELSAVSECSITRNREKGILPFYKPVKKKKKAKKPMPEKSERSIR